MKTRIVFYDKNSVGAHLVNILSRRDIHTILVMGSPGSGKTSLLRSVHDTIKNSLLVPYSPSFDCCASLVNNKNVNAGTILLDEPTNGCSASERYEFVKKTIFHACTRNNKFIIATHDALLLPFADLCIIMLKNKFCIISPQEFVKDEKIFIKPLSKSEFVKYFRNKWNELSDALGLKLSRPPEKIISKMYAPNIAWSWEIRYLCRVIIENIGKRKSAKVDMENEIKNVVDDINCQRSEDFYDKIAKDYKNTYERGIDATKEEVDSIRRHLAPLKNIVLLDIGCGTGRSLSIWEKMMNVKTFGLDASMEMLKIARDNLSNSRLVKGDMTELTSLFGKYTFDCIICMHSTICHLGGIKEFESFVQKVRTVLKPDGMFIFDFPDSKIISGGAVNEQFLIKKMTMNRYVFFDIKTGASTFYWIPDYLQASEMIKRLGLDIVDVQEKGKSITFFAKRM